MKQRVRLSVGAFHYLAGAALFAMPWITRIYSVEGVIDSVLGGIIIVSSAFANFELGILRFMTYREHLITTLSASVALCIFSLFQLATGALHMSWMVSAVISIVITAWSLKLHLPARKLSSRMSFE